MTESKKFDEVSRTIFAVNPDLDTLAKIRDMVNDAIRQKIVMRQACKGLDGRFTPIIQDGCCGA